VWANSTAPPLTKVASYQVWKAALNVLGVGQAQVILIINQSMIVPTCLSSHMPWPTGTVCSIDHKVAVKLGFQQAAFHDNITSVTACRTSETTWSAPASWTGTGT
jgi:hypothetical protein